MSRKKKNTKKNQSNAVQIDVYNDETQEDKAARVFTKPSVLAAMSIKDRYKHEDLINVNDVNNALSKQIKQVKEGNLERMEEMLVSQAHTLDSLFNEMLIRSRNNMGEYFTAAQKYMSLALKAQSQCRTTVEALGEIKNPKPYIQNNRAQYQQVNNNGNRSHARENLKTSNELLEDNSHEQQWMDGGTQKAASGNDPELEAVDA